MPPDARLEGDVCIAGAGPAGLSLALTLARAGRRVLLLESGRFEAEATIDDLNVFENAGAPLGSLSLRDRRFGGTGWYGRILPMDAIDLEERAWADSPGWPVPFAGIERYYREAARFLGFERPEALDGAWWRGDAAARALDGDGITPSLHLIARSKDLGARYRRAVESEARLTAVIDATVTVIEVDESGSRVTGLRAAAAGGEPVLPARAGRYVLAGGGLENARLLLLLSGDRPGVLGPSEAVLGRGYINHPRSEGVGRLYLDPAHADFAALYRGLVEHTSRRSRCSVQIAAALDPAVQRAERLLNASAFFYPASDPRLARLREPLDRIRRSAEGLRFEPGDWSRIGQLARNLPLLAGAAVARMRQRPYRLDHLVVVDQLEQAPEPGSRLSLGAARDRLGRRRLRVEWRVDTRTRQTHRRFHELLAARIAAGGLGRLQSALLEDPDFEPAYEDNAHPMGATRMSRTAHDGVVDEDGRVHALSNLYVAGSSVFPAGGQANPTLTIVALALRLATHLLATDRR